jgi:hypothetical protein
MKTSLWVVVVMVSTLVGFLMGYSVSSYTGMRSLQKVEEERLAAGARAAERAAAPAPAPVAPAPGTPEKPAAAAPAPAISPAKPAAPKAEGGGYGAAAPKADSGGYGAEKPTAPKKAARKKAASADLPAKTGGY